MLKNASYKEKFVMLEGWLPIILEEIKRDLKQDHLKRDALFMKKYFPGKSFNKLTLEDLSQGYLKAIADDSEVLGEFISNRWLLKHGDIYQCFEEELTKINPNFNALDELELEQSRQIVGKSVVQFGAPTTYLFSVLNSVVFPGEIYKQLAEEALREVEADRSGKKKDAGVKSLEMLQHEHEAELGRLVDKYEKKLLGLQKKYVTDVEALKKQVASLQRKLVEGRHG